MTISGGSSESPDRVSRLIQLLAEERKNFTSIEIAETLWLALQIEPVALVTPDESSQPALPPSPLPSIPPAPNFELELLPPLPPQPAPRANIAAPTPQVGVLPPQTLPIWLADPPLLTDALAIIRALKPLLQKVDAGIGKRLDEPATVDTIARTRLCIPILKPDQEPWFDIILVVDQGSSMHIWQRLVQDLVRILRRYGAFRDLQVFDLMVNPVNSPNPSLRADDKVQLISNPNRPGHRPKELIDQRGQRIAIVLSDCAGAYWWDGTLLPMLQEWGKIMPTVIWQMLPPWMWKRTALGRGTVVAISNDIPGAANQQLQTRSQEREDPDEQQQRIPMPVVTSEVRDLTRWSLMIAGDRREVAPGFLLPQRGGSVPRSKPLEEIAQDRAQQALDEDREADEETAFNQALDTIVRERVQRFLELSSSQAQRLIMLLAAAPVITLPVVRLIREAMRYEAASPLAESPLPIAEVFLSGLLLRLPGQSEAELEQVVQVERDRMQAELESQTGEQPDETGPEPVLFDWQDLVQYDFAPQVRNVLLEALPAVDTLEVINSVSAAVERRWNRISDQDFRAFLTNPAVDVPPELAGLRSFASVTAEILEQLGGDYANFAQGLRQGVGEERPYKLEINFLKYRQHETSQDDEFRLEDLEYEVAKLISFPPIESCEYESATITAILDRFDFETACFARLPQSPHSNKAYQKLLENYLLTTFPTEPELEQFLETTFSSYRSSPAIASLRLRTSELRQKVAVIVDEICHDGQLLTIVTDRLCDRDPQARAVLLEGAIFRRQAIVWGYTERLGSETETENPIDLDMIAIPGGSFTMGAPKSEPASEDNERPQHEVTLQPFYLGRYPITQAQWRVVAGYDRVNRDLDPDPSSFKGDQRPVEYVSWDDAQEFCQRLSAKTRKDYRLPSEAQWEYACRAGTTTAFHFSEMILPELVNYNTKVSYNDSPTAESRGETTDVGSFPANDWGLHDMHGNVLEWCEDDYHNSYEGAPDDGSAWIESDRAETRRLLRGGSWDNNPRDCRSACPVNGSRDNRYGFIGFRVCCVPPRTLPA